MLALDDPESNVVVLNRITTKPKPIDESEGVVNIQIKDFISQSDVISIVEVAVEPPIVSSDFVVSYKEDDESWVRIADSEHMVPKLKNSVANTRTIVNGKHLSRGFIVESVCPASGVGLFAFVPWYGSVPKVCGWYKVVKKGNRATRQFFSAAKYDGGDVVDYPTYISEMVDNITEANVIALNTFKKLRSEDVTYTDTFDLLIRLNRMLYDSIDPPYMLKVMLTICAISNGVVQ